HNRPYKPTLDSLSTNKVFYTTNYTTGLDVGTYVSNTYFEENGFKFEPSNRKLGSVVRMWEVIAEGDRIQLELAYPRFTTLPRGYSLYRSTSTSGPWTKISVYIPWEAPLAKVTYTDKVPSPGKYYYTVAAVYNDIEGATNSVSEDTVGVAVNNSHLSPAPSYLTIPHLWAFGSGGYKGSIFATKDTHQGGEQIAGGQSKGNYTWITWGAITNGTNPKYALYRGLTTAHTATEPVMLTKRNLLTGANTTKLELPSGDVGLYNSSETNRANYIQHSLSLEVAVSNTFTNFFGDVVTVQSGSRGIEFYEARDPYTDTALEAPTGGAATINKNTYITHKMYTVDLSWYRSQGAQGYTIMLKNLGDNTTSFLTNISILTGDPASFHLSAPATNLTLGTSYEYLIIATNFNPPKKGGTNVVPYTHITPLPPVVRSVSTNARGEITNLVGRNETLRVYWGVTSASSMITGRVIQRWTISLQDKGAILISWDKNPSGETPDYYKIYRTSRPNSSGDLAMDSMSSWQSPKLLGTVAGTQPLTWRDDLTETTALADRRGSGTPFKYPMYYYRITGVKRLANGVEVESLPSYFTNLSTGATGAVAGGSAINPEDVYAAPDYVNVVFDYSKSTGWGNYRVFTGPESPAGIELFGIRTRGTSSYPPNPFWVAWGTSPSSSGAAFWVRKNFRASRSWPGFANLNLTDHNYSGNNASTTYVATHAKPTTRRFIEFSNSGSLSGGNPNTTLYDTSSRQGGAAFEVISVNANVVLDGLPLKGESRGLWYHQTDY
ncbi:MAG: hypothetical protein ACRCY4_10280, partial [Brevinema sp.]